MAFLCLQGSTIGLQNLNILLRHFFLPLRARIGPLNRFYQLFMISDQKQKIDISQGVLYYFFSKIQKFFSLFTILRDFTKLGNVPKQVVEEKNSIISGQVRSQDNRLHVLNRNCSFYFLKNKIYEENKKQ